MLITPLLKANDKTEVFQLQAIVLPNLEICTVEALYIRLDDDCFLDYEQNQIEFKPNGKLSFDTYFNAFSVDKWKNYTSVKAIHFYLKFKGKFRIKLLNLGQFSSSPVLVSQKILEHQTLYEECLFSDIDIHAYQGLLYLELEALEENCLFTGGWIGTTTELDEQKTPKIAIVICTYRREAYVQRNVQALRSTLLNDSQNNFEIFIIDNGRTLKEFNHSCIHVIPNKNAGGSGGYTRGVIEVLEREDEFTHIIFMDDDVIIDPEVVKRVYSFQRLINSKTLCLGGSMLKLDTKYIQHENGAIWDDGTICLKPDLDLREVENILLNEVEEYINYNGWWFFCFPLTVIDRDNLPYPFFIKMDDMELPIRLQYQIITLNSICVWHEPLENKYSPLINYYLRRNELILKSLVSDEFSGIQAAKQAFKFSIREAFCYRYKNANLVLKAVNDFLAGPTYIKSIDPEQKNLELISLGEKPVRNSIQQFIQSKYQESVEQSETTLHRWFRLATLNGHLLPLFLFFSDTALKSKGYRIAPIHQYRPVNVFRAKTVLYYQPTTREGFTVQFSRIEFFRVLWSAIVISWKLLLSFPALKQQYRDMRPEMTTLEFWKTYLNLKH
ncbi:galactofuranosyl transferase [Leptolyngbya sp. NIES-2104]|nr:galactofuranosyl transferase [Leptolyngbya sp. NIES-2104]